MIFLVDDGDCMVLDVGALTIYGTLLTRFMGY